MSTWRHAVSTARQNSRRSVGISATGRASSAQVLMLDPVGLPEQGEEEIGPVALGERGGGLPALEHGPGRGREPVRAVRLEVDREFGGIGRTEASLHLGAKFARVGNEVVREHPRDEETVERITGLEREVDDPDLHSLAGEAVPHRLDRPERLHELGLTRPAGRFREPVDPELARVPARRAGVPRRDRLRRVDRREGGAHAPADQRLEERQLARRHEGVQQVERPPVEAEDKEPTRDGAVMVLAANLRTDTG